jgi:hypothetical protein
VHPRKAETTIASSPEPITIDPKVDSRLAGDNSRLAGDNSFPILSKHPSLSMVEEDSEDSETDARIVRFSKDESYTHVFDDSSDRPFDEDDETRPDSASGSNPPPGPPDTASAASPPSSSRSFQSLNSSSSGGLKSILRPARFSPAKSYPDMGEHDGGDEVLNTSISKSPPRGSTGFVDDGVELSPIARGHRVSVDGSSSGVKFHKTIEDANTLYPDPSLEAPTEYSDPTIDTSGGFNVSMMDSIFAASSQRFLMPVSQLVVFRQTRNP